MEVRGMREALGEEEVRALIARYGIPSPEGGVARSEEEAGAIAGRVGYPVALKALTQGLRGCRRHGCLLLDIGSEDGVREGYRKVLEAAEVASTGAQSGRVLVQRMVPQGREVRVGFIRGEFGLAVTLGLSGLFTDVLGDTAYKTAPVSRDGVLGMVEGLKNREILLEGGCDLEALAGVVDALSRLGLERPEILGLEIDPLFLYPEGALALRVRLIPAPGV
ncbi:MAG: acetate--CoA ligase family protein [Candidatus Hydrothermarchaeota archaeon]